MTSLESFSQAGKNSWSLVVDTSKVEGSLTILNKDKQRLQKISWGKEERHTEVLLKNFNSLLKTFDKKNLSTIYFIKGPGSFTGLRVGAAFVKSLSYAAGNIPIISISSFLEDAQTVISQNKNLTHFTILIPSIRKKVFSAKFILSNDRWVESINMSGSDEITEEPENYFSSHIRALDAHPAIVHIQKQDESLEQAISDTTKIDYYIQNNSYLDLYPLYLRQSEAEEKLIYDKTKL